MMALETDIVGHVAGMQSYYGHRLGQSQRERFAVRLFDADGRTEEVFGERHISATNTCEIRTIAQWLGTPVGSRFVAEGLKRGFVGQWRKRQPVGFRSVPAIDMMMDVEWNRSGQRGTPVPATKEQHELALQIMRWLNTAPGKAWAREMVDQPQLEEDD